MGKGRTEAEEEVLGQEQGLGEGGDQEAGSMLDA